MKVSADYRALARASLRGKWKMAVLTGVAASALGASIVNSTSDITSRVNQNSDMTPGDYAVLFSQPGVGGLLKALVLLIVVWAMFKLIVGGAARLGYARFNLNLVDGADASAADLLSQKSRMWEGFCMKFLQGLYVALWSLLLVIPGIVKSYSYAMTPYIMAEHPALTANEAITESRRVMDGNKWRLFCLDFSFLGWELLCSLPLLVGLSIVLAVFANAEALCVVLLILLAVPLSAGYFFLHPYEEAAWAVFYRDITAAQVTEDAPTA